MIRGPNISMSTVYEGHGNEIIVVQAMPNQLGHQSYVSVNVNTLWPGEDWEPLTWGDNKLTIFAIKNMLHAMSAMIFYWLVGLGTGGLF